VAEQLLKGKVKKMRQTISFFLTLCSLCVFMQRTNAQQPSPDEVKKAFQTCKEHRLPLPSTVKNGKVIFTPLDPRNKDWAPGWGDAPGEAGCSAIQDAYEALERPAASAREESERSGVAGLAAKLKTGK
jgi:hypothetical protein